MELKGLTALVTGAGGGIGREICLELAKNGVNVILFGGNNVDKLQKTADLVDKQGVNAYILAGDITCDKVIKDNFDRIEKDLGKFDILINNAGMAINCTLEHTPIETFDKIMAINCRSPYIITQNALPYLRTSNRASIINIVSVTGHAGYPLQSAYVASKHALLGWTKSLANEVYRENIRVHAISPGGVYTDMIKVSRPDLTSEGMIMPKDIADIVMFFLTNRGNAVVDEIIVHRLKKEPFSV